MAHSPHANILEQARLSLAPGHVARRANAYLIALVSRSAAMMTWENHASAIPSHSLTAPPLPEQALQRVARISRADRHATRRPDPKVQFFPPPPLPHCTHCLPPFLLWRTALPGIGMIMNHRTIKV
jgi:hypothetical protein